MFGLKQWYMIKLEESWRFFLEDVDTLYYNLGTFSDSWVQSWYFLVKIPLMFINLDLSVLFLKESPLNLSCPTTYLPPPPLHIVICNTFLQLYWNPPHWILLRTPINKQTNQQTKTLFLWSGTHPCCPALLGTIVVRCCWDKTDLLVFSHPYPLSAKATRIFMPRWPAFRALLPALPVIRYTCLPAQSLSCVHPVDCSSPGSSVRGVSEARILD